jgi:pilus assembly protein FimV
MNNDNPRGDATFSHQSMATMHRWKFSALAAATLASVALYAPNALALALGPITVQSALGEPLRAEIDLPRITPAEAESLKATTASSETFRSQGLEYSSAVSQLRIALQRLPDGRSVLRLTSDRPVNEPFVDLVIDATWATGRITRSYTMLFDPPALRRPPPAVTAAPQVSAPAQSPARASAVPPPRPAAPASLPPPLAAESADSVSVKAGDTAGRIANAHRPRDISLDQMLVALLRANPDAFIDGNVNRLKAGAVLQLPDAAQAAATPASQARQTIAAQSRDFNAYRRKLAGAASTAQTTAAGRSESGRVQAQVQEQTPASVSPDKLTLSKGAVKGSKATPEALAARKQANEASARVEELSKNISELNKLAAAGSESAPSGGAAGAPAPEGAPSPGPAVTAPAAAVPPAAPAAGTEPATTSAPATTDLPAPAVAASAAAPAQAASSPAPAEAATAPAMVASSEMVPAPAAAPASQADAAPPAPSAPAQEPGFVDGLLEDPLVPGAILLLLLLLGYGGYRVAQNRRSAAGVDSSFLESKLQPDSFFGASGGQRVDTAGSDSSTGSSMAYSPSQLDAGGDVDPVAEADVYLAYGRDLQAEEILKEAIRHNPDRISVHAKLAEIYAKRQDRKALEVVAKDIYRLTNGQGTDWNRVCELGRELDPENRFYQPGGQTVEEPEFTPPSSFASTYGASEGPPSLPSELDLDLDLDLPDDALTEAPAPAQAPAADAGGATAPAAAGSFAAAATAAAMAASAEGEPQSAPPSSAQEPAWTPPTGPTPLAQAPAARSDDLDFPMDLPALDTQPHALDLSPPAPFVPSDSGLMDFDLDHLSLDLNAADAPDASTERAPAEATPEVPEDPLATKLALAHEFNAIGDSDGARTLIEEVIAESSGDLKARAQRMLSELN